MSAVKLVIFDWDGTVMDSVGRIVSSMQAAAMHTGVAVPSTAAVRHIIGLSLDPAFDLLFPSANQAQRQQLFEHYRDQYVLHDTTPTPLFADAEKEQNEAGDASMLHIVILDEMDAICKQRGSVKDGTGVSDSVVNQLLSKIDVSAN